MKPTFAHDFLLGVGLLIQDAKLIIAIYQHNARVIAILHSALILLQSTPVGSGGGSEGGGEGRGGGKEKRGVRRMGVRRGDKRGDARVTAILSTALSSSRRAAQWGQSGVRGEQEAGEKGGEFEQRVFRRGCQKGWGVKEGGVRVTSV